MYHLCSYLLFYHRDRFFGVGSRQKVSRAVSIVDFSPTFFRRFSPLRLKYFMPAVVQSRLYINVLFLRK